MPSSMTTSDPASPDSVAPAEEPRRRQSVVIDAFESSVARYRDSHTIVAVDVIRATTMTVTALGQGRRCVVAADLGDALAWRGLLPDALLAGEIGGRMPPAFEMNNSPAELAAREDVERPLVILSSSGTSLMLAAGRAARGAYLACFRNLRAVVHHLGRQAGPIALIGAGSRGEFREEDQMACAWLAEGLLDAGYRPEDDRTMELVERWSGLPLDACRASNSVDYLRRSGQLRDLDFILEHIDDLDLVCRMRGFEALADLESPSPRVVTRS
jgi:2-phosphosulfolactate phosphatase